MFAVIYNPAAELLHVMDLPGQMRPFCVSWSCVRLAHCSGGLMVSPAVVVRPHTCGLLARITPKTHIHIKRLDQQLLRRFNGSFSAVISFCSDGASERMTYSK